ncbi:MAG TPA: sulfotransferase [Azospirillum sp.]|nr:sulfotransferase [Azospirillum sp.]
MPTALAGERPVVLGATGGTGSSMLRTALAGVGAYMGEVLPVGCEAELGRPLTGVEVNRHGDFLPFMAVLDRIVPAILRVVRRLDYAVSDLPSDLARDALGAVRRTVDGLRTGKPEGAAVWGWKNPRTIFVLPLLAEVMPDLTYVHVIRDGRAVAISPNQIQMERHYADLFTEQPGPDTAVASIRFWAATNLQAMACGRRLFGSRYHLFRLEDATATGDGSFPALVRDLLPGCPAERLEAARAILVPPSRHGWEDLPPDRRAAIEAAGADGLARFGYRPLGRS